MNFVNRWWWLFVLGVLAAAIPAAMLASDERTVYKSTATMFVVNDPEASERLTNSYAELVKIRPVLNAIRQRLAVNESDDQLRARLDVSTNFNTQMIRVTAEYPDANLAAAIANTAASATVDHIDLFVGRAGTIKVVETAEAAPKPARQPVTTRAVLAGGLGFLVALSIAIGVESLRTNRRADYSAEPMAPAPARAARQRPPQRASPDAQV